jgi:uncharacterized protein (UPF0212 family)
MIVIFTREQIEQAITEWLTRLNLNHFVVKVKWDDTPDDKDIGACIHVIDGRDYATIRFEHNIFNVDADEINNDIAHELLHIHLTRLYDMPYKMLDVDNGEMKMLLNYLRDEIEHVTDRLATALCRAMPLPKSLQEQGGTVSNNNPPS